MWSSNFRAHRLLSLMDMPIGVLRRIGRASVRERGAAFIHVGCSGLLKALAAVRSTAYNLCVVVVLSVVLPPALAADFVPSALG